MQSEKAIGNKNGFSWASEIDIEGCPGNIGWMRIEKTDRSLSLSSQKKSQKTVFERSPFSTPSTHLRKNFHFLTLHIASTPVSFHLVYENRQLHALPFQLLFQLGIIIILYQLFSFIYLLGISFDDKEFDNFAKSWEVSANQCRRLIRYIVGSDSGQPLTPHRVRDTQSCERGPTSDHVIGPTIG